MNMPKRTRLSPHDRRMQLLDCAQTVIQDRGLSSFTMETLAREAGVSNPLIYKYFDTRLALLQELLVREYRLFSETTREQLIKARGFEEMTTLAVSTNFETVSNGNILSILRSQPDIHEAIVELEKKEMKQHQYGRILVKELADSYQITLGQAEQIIVMGSGASQAAAEHYRQYGGNKNKLIKDTVRFIFGGIETIVS